MLGRLRAFRERDATRFASHMERLGANAGQAVAAWNAEDTAGVLGAIAGYESGLRQLDEAAGIGIFSPVHERLRAIAVKHGAVYKPSGAGGGDFGIALTDSRDGGPGRARRLRRGGIPGAGCRTVRAGAQRARRLQPRDFAGSSAARPATAG